MLCHRPCCVHTVYMVDIYTASERERETWRWWICRRDSLLYCNKGLGCSRHGSKHPTQSLDIPWLIIQIKMNETWSAHQQSKVGMLCCGSSRWWCFVHIFPYYFVCLDPACIVDDFRTSTSSSDFATGSIALTDWFISKIRRRLTAISRFMGWVAD